MRIILCTFFLFLLILVTLHCGDIYAQSNSDIKSLKNKGDEALKKGNYTEAIYFYDQILKIEPENISTTINKGVALGNTGKFNESVSEFNKVLKIDPNNLNALNNRGSAFIKLGKYNEAISDFDKVLALHPNDRAALANKMFAVNHSALLTQGEQENIRVFVQIQIRTADGQLVGYIETGRIGVLHPELLNAMLNLATVQESNFIENGRLYEKFTFRVNHFYDGSHGEYSVINGEYLERGNAKLFQSIHDGYAVRIGDKYSVVWTVISPYKITMVTQ